MIFYHNLSKSEDWAELPEPIEGPDTLPVDMDKWLQYFPQACSRAWGGTHTWQLLLAVMSHSQNLSKAWPHGCRPTNMECGCQSYRPRSQFQVDCCSLHKWWTRKSLPARLPMQSWASQSDYAGKWLMWGHRAPPQKYSRSKCVCFVGKLDMPRAKPLLMAMYSNKLEPSHMLLLGIWMWLVSEVDTVLNTKGRANINHLHACQNTWISGKLVFIKTWEIKLLDHFNEELKMSLRLAMMGQHQQTRT